LADYLLGIDIGTTACKTVLFDIRGRLIARASKEYPVHYPRPTWAEQNADRWWNAAKVTVKEVLKKARRPAENIAGIGVDSQREAAVPLDAQGRKLANSLIWIDRRTVPQAEKISRLLPSRKIIETTGVPIDYLYSAAKILWIKEERSKVFRKTKCFLFAKDYIVYKLTGEQATDYSLASRTMLFDIKKREWSEEICDTLGIPIALLPRPVDSSEVVGEISLKASMSTGLKKGIPVVSGGGDRPCEAIGGGVTEPGYVNIGTGTATVMTTPLLKPKVDMKGRIDCCCHVIPDMWEYEIPILTTGASLRWFRDNFGYEEIEKSRKTGVDPYVYLDSLAEKVEAGSDGLFYYPYPMGAKSPKFNTIARAVFFGVTLTHTKAHFARSILEGIAFQYAETVELIEGLGIRVKGASIVGGEARSQLWNQIKADALARPIKQPEVEDAAALGSAILSSLGAEIYDTVKTAVKNMVRTRRNYRPREKEKRTYSSFYEKYKKIYEEFEDGYKILM